MLKFTKILGIATIFLYSLDLSLEIGSLYGNSETCVKCLFDYPQCIYFNF